MRNIVSISDIHLSQLEPSNGLWMRYRQAPFVPDHELVAMLDTLRERVRGEELELVLNGDIFDFDVPWITDGKIYFPKAKRSPEIAFPVMHDILRDHSAFILALARVLVEGHTLVFISGNHDTEMTFESIRSVIREALLDAALSVEGNLSRESLSSRILFRAWFYLSPDRVLFEHGQQYDEMNCFRTVMLPYDHSGKDIAPTLGALGTRYLGARFGYFNPNVDESYSLTVKGYLWHWIKYYLFTSRSFIRTFCVGCIKSTVALIKNRGEVPDEQKEKNIVAAVQENGVSRALIVRHLALAKTPIDENFWHLLNDLGLDRLMLVILCLIPAALWVHFAHGWKELGAIVPFGIYALYSYIVPAQKSHGDLWRRVQDSTYDIAGIYQASAVVFGHTHRAESKWINGVFFGNSGSWSAAYKDIECTIPLTKEKPLIWLRKKEAASPLEGGLMAWRDGKIDEYV